MKLEQPSTLHRSLLFPLLAILALVPQTTAHAASVGLEFTPEASFDVTLHPELGLPVKGMGFDPVAEHVHVLARFLPLPVEVLSIFEFSTAEGNFGNFVEDNSIFSLNFRATTIDSFHGVTYSLQDQGGRIVINPRPFRVRNDPPTSGDFVVNETGPAGITHDERDGTHHLLLWDNGVNSGQQIIRIPRISGTILSRLPIDPDLAVDADSELVLDPVGGSYWISVGTRVFEVDTAGEQTGRFFDVPGDSKIMGMEFGLGDEFYVLTEDGTVTQGTLGVACPCSSTNALFSAVASGTSPVVTVLQCRDDAESAGILAVLNDGTSAGAASGTRGGRPPQCGTQVLPSGSTDFMLITPEEDEACRQLLRSGCPSSVLP